LEEDGNCLGTGTEGKANNSGDYSYPEARFRRA